MFSRVGVRPAREKNALRYSIVEHTLRESRREGRSGTARQTTTGLYNGPVVPALKRLSYRFTGVRFIAVLKQKRALNALPQVACNATPLSRSINHLTLKQIFSSAQTNDEWTGIENTIACCDIPDDAAGVNRGDRRALYYLVRSLRPRSILEIGTSIGASTIHAAAALKTNRLEDDQPYRLTTVDIVDVNNTAQKPWVDEGATYSPRDMLRRIGAADDVTFVTAPSLHYLASCEDRYDFVFLDGDHSATTVYQEIPPALRVLRQGGVILLHDYFPDLGPLWSDRSLIPGPWLATQRLIRECGKLRALPLGALPWKTKLNSQVTSLALLVGT